MKQSDARSAPGEFGGYFAPTKQRNYRGLNDSLVFFVIPTKKDAEVKNSKALHFLG